MTLSIIIGSFINVLILFDGNKDNAILFMMMTLIVVISIKGALYFFKYSSSFTKQYFFDDDKVLIIGGKEKELEYLITKIVYRRILGVLEIETENNQKVILINNLAPDFIDYKNFLLSKSIASSKWL